MEHLSQVWKIARRRLLTPKLLLYTAVLFSASFKFNAPLRALILELNYPVTWCLFPFMCSMPYYLALISFGVLYIHSDVPFMQMENMYATIRVGRGTWLWGQICGIFLRSVLAVAVAVGCSYANLVPYIELSGQWGRMASTIANTSVGYEANLYYYFWDQAMLVVSPFRLMALNVVVVVLLAFFLGLLLFFGLFPRKNISVFLEILEQIWNPFAAVRTDIKYLTASGEPQPSGCLSRISFSMVDLCDNSDHRARADCRAARRIKRIWFYRAYQEAHDISFARIYGKCL